MNKVAIITRTLNRPILLRRAAQSILNQTFDDYIWVVVNDGGEKEPINDAVSNFPEDKVIVIHNPRRVGMEAASNIGLKSSESEYVVIHDDDDTWHPEFLKKTVSYLDARGPSDIQQGVVTYNELVFEEISGDSIKIEKREPGNILMTSTTLYRILAWNTFSTLAFLYRRTVLEEIGYYDESLPILGDWEFNIRFLLKYDIGLIPEILAYYHRRQDRDTNTFIDGSQYHQYYDTLLRNRYLRKDIQSGTVGVGFYMNVARSFEIIHTNQRNAIAEKDARIAQLQEHAQQKDARIAQLQEHAQQKDAQINQLQEHAEQKDAQINQLQCEINKMLRLKSVRLHRTLDKVLRRMGIL